MTETLFNKPLILTNPIQKYAWGSHSSIQNLLGSSATGEPWAELWMGAHPKAPSQVTLDDEEITLDNLINKYPEEILGKKTVKKFGDTLPYLFKLLAAEQPLSIQAHPNIEQARRGFLRENDLGVPLNAPDRNYKDQQHKPECICALTPFVALKGFRKNEAILDMLKNFCPLSSKELMDILDHDGLQAFFKSLMELSVHGAEKIIKETVQNANKPSSNSIVAEWVLKLHKKYPADIGILSPAILNLVYLEKGQALFLPAGELHAYLDGFGIELMANSDNVLRGGLTPKHIDVKELLEVLNFNESAVNIILPDAISDTEKRYPPFADEFLLSVISVDQQSLHTSLNNESIEIFICIEGDCSITALPEEHSISISKGMSFLLPANIRQYQINGNAKLYKASVPV